MLNEMISKLQLPEIPNDREVIKEILQREIYGKMPPAPDSVSYKEEMVMDRYPEVDLKKVTITVTVEKRQFSFPIMTLVHTDNKPRPFFIHINFRPDVPDMYMPSEEIADNGFNVISFCYKDVSSDSDDFTDGLADIFIGSEKRKGDTPGKIILWAWAAMRALDYAETNPVFDMNNAAVAGHSRLGKTAFVTAMFDTRFKFAFSNNSGCCGDALTRGKGGETIADITSANTFYYWFCENLKKYANNHEAMPCDQHFLLSSIAPRYAYVSSSSEDSWADTKYEYLNCIASSDYFEKKGVPGFIATDKFPENSEKFHDGHIGYHIKEGKHFFSRRDWILYMEYFKKHIND